MRLARFMAKYLEFFYKGLSKPPPLTRDQLLMLEEDNVGDPKRTTEAFNLQLTKFEDGITAYLGQKPGNKIKVGDLE